MSDSYLSFRMAVMTVGLLLVIVLWPIEVFILFEVALRDISIKLIFYTTTLKIYHLSFINSRIPKSHQYSPFCYKGISLLHL